MRKRGKEAKKFRPEDPIKITSSLDTSAERGITRGAKERETKNETRSRGYIKDSSPSP